MGWNDIRDSSGWANRIRIGLAADLICSLPERVEDLGPTRQWLNRDIVNPDRDESMDILLSLPAEAMRSLRVAYSHSGLWHLTDSSKIERRRQLVERAFRTLIEGDKPAILRAKLLAHHITYGDADADRLVTLARDIFERKFPAKNLHLMEDALSVLRSPASHSAAIHNAIDQIIGSVLDEMPYATQLENFLRRSAFAWPLVVVPNSEGACSVPVDVDVFMAAPESEKLDLVLPPSTRQDEGLTVAWRSSLHTAVVAAKNAWRSKRGGWGDEVRESVRNALVRFDFGCATQVASSPLPPLQLYDRSAEIYLSQVVLSRFLGRPRGVLAAASGQIEDPVRRIRADGKIIQTLDREIAWPQEVDAKFRYVLRTSFYERLVLPVPEQPWNAKIPEREKRDLTGSPVDVCFAAQYSNVADAVQPDGWRQYRYVRADDVCRWVHSATGRSRRFERDAEAIAYWRTTLERSETGILTVNCADKVFATRSLCGAVLNLNLELHNRVSAPPWISWLVIRMVADEQDERFFKTLFTACGAHPDDWTAFQRATSWDDAADRLAEMLDRVEARVDCLSHRAPDLIVLEGLDALPEAVETPKARRFFVHEVLKRLGTRLRGPTHPSYAPYLGRTRMVILRSASAGGNADLRFDLVRHPRPQQTPQIPAADLPSLVPLTVFRSGFSHLAALLVLRGLRKEMPPDVLDRWVDARLLVRSQGRYLFPQAVRRALEASAPRFARDIAQAHFLAGNFYAPYFLATEYPAVSAEEAFLPWHIHEAEHHFKQAFDLAKRDASLRGLQGRARVIRGKLAMYCEDLSWSTVTQLLKYGHDGEALARAQEMAAAWTADGRILHPRWLTSMGDIRGIQATKRPEDAAELELDAEGYYREAMAAAEHPEFSSEASFNIIRTQAVLAAFLLSARRLGPRAWNEGVELARRVTDQALIRGDEALSAINGSLWEVLGDEHSVNEEALEFYMRGCRHAPAFGTTFVRCLGVLAMMGRTADARTQAKDIQQRRSAITHSLDKGQTMLHRAMLPETPLAVRTGFERLVRGLQCLQGFGLARGFEFDIEALAGRAAALPPPRVSRDGVDEPFRQHRTGLEGGL